MQLAAVTEIITQFIGLFRVIDEPARTWVKPDGAGQAHSISLDDAHAAQARKGSEATQSVPSTPFTIRDHPSDPNQILHGWKGSLHDLPATPSAPINFSPFHPEKSPTITGGGALEPRSASAVIESDATTVVVWNGADQTVVDDHQANVLIANVSYVDNPGAGPIPIPSDAPIAAMIAQSYATVPHDAPILGASASQELVYVKSFQDGMATGSVTPVHSLNEGSYTDGVMTSSDGSPVPLTLPVTSLNTATPTANGVPLGQAIVMGHNIAGNVALIVDTSSAPLTKIVEGNAFHADLIIQSNVVQNIDQVSITANAMVAGSILSGGNSIHNTAHFDQLPNVVSASVTASFGQHWNVQVVDGDFYDINSVTQHNVLINNTLYAGTPMTDHYYAVLGGNTQLNQASFVHDAPSYDLLIVLGNSYSANAIYQHNVLLNDTKTGVEVSTSNDGTNTITAGHNTVTNDAAIVEYGTHSWHPTNTDIQALVHALSTKGDFTGSISGLANFGGTINVQLVTGDYYNFNLIMQTNIVANSSMTLADLTKAGVEVPTSVTVGHNILSNSAAIITAGPLETQYVAGKPYETAMLVQSNIVTAHADVGGGSAGALVPELVAFLDTENVHDVTGSTASTSATLATASAHQDILAGHLH